MCMAWNGLGGYLWALDNATNVLYQVDQSGDVRDVLALPD